MRWTIGLFMMIILIHVSYSCSKTGSTTSMENWDADHDTRLNRAEFHTSFKDLAYYDLWDEDRDSSVNEFEWDSGVKLYHPNYNMGKWGKYADWDKDMNKVLDKDELSKKTFDMYDVNGDGYIENNEFEKWYFSIDSTTRKMRKRR